MDRMSVPTKMGRENRLFCALPARGRERRCSISEAHYAEPLADIKCLRIHNGYEDSHRPIKLLYQLFSVNNYGIQYQISRRTRELFPEHVNLTAGLCVTADIQQHRTDDKSSRDRFVRLRPALRSLADKDP